MTKPKAVNIAVIAEDQEPELYAMMGDLVAAHHPELDGAKIALAWRYGWKADPDGRLTLGQFKKAGDLDRQLHGFDAVIVLNYEAWSAAEFGCEQKAALLDHELCHGGLAMDEEGEPKRDEDGRAVYRVRKHDIEEFVAVVKRHGLWEHDLVRFAEAAMDAKKHPLLAALDDLRPKKGSGVKSVTIEAGGESVTLEAN